MECGLANKIMSYDYDEALIELINLFSKNAYLEDIVYLYIYQCINKKYILFCCILIKHKVHDFIVPFLQKKIKS